MNNQTVSLNVNVMDDFLIEELETRLEMGTCYHFVCQQRDWQGHCTYFGPSTGASYNVTPAQCTAEGDIYVNY